MRQPNAIDFWRGFALVTIFVNHIPGGYFERFTHRNFGYSDSAELFVFLAGWSLRHLVGDHDRPTPTSRLVLRLGGRGITIYAAQIVITMLALALTAATALYLGDPFVLEWNNAAPVFQDPVPTHVGLVLLTHQLGYFDILPLYVVLMLSATFFALVDRYAPALLVPVSLALYLAAIVTGSNLPTWPVEGRWFFNPFCWQLIFVLGFALARPDGWAPKIRAATRHLRIPAALLVAGGAVLVVRNWFPDPLAVPRPTLLFVADKTYLSPLRLLHFLAVAIAASGLFPLIARLLPKLVAYLSMLGRNSLNVFCVGSLLSLVGQIVRVLSDGSIAADAIMVLGGILILGVTAWVSEWRERSRMPVS